MTTTIMPNPISGQNCSVLAEQVLQLAKKQGASASEVDIVISKGYSVTMRLGEVDVLEHHRDKSLAVTVYFGQKKGSASTSDTSEQALAATVLKACEIAQYTQEDPCAGLAPREILAYDYPNLALHFPWDLSVENAMVLAKNCEAQALQFDKRITNSEGASVSTGQSYAVYANSNDFIGAYATTRHSISCSVVAEVNGMMERDMSYTTARDATDLISIDVIARQAAERTIQRLQPRKINTAKVPVIFDKEIAPGFFSSCLSAIRGGNLYRRSSFLLDHLGKAIFPAFVTLEERAYIDKGLASSPFDSEGVRPQDRAIIEQGILKSYILGTYSARKLGMQSTGNAGGTHNLSVTTSSQSLQDLCKSMQRGLLVTELLGQGVNLVTGDYSRGASGFWVEHGEIQFPVAEVTIAGNLKEMYQNVVAIGNDINLNSSLRTGSVLIGEMMVAGS